MNCRTAVTWPSLCLAAGLTILLAACVAGAGGSIDATTRATEQTTLDGLTPTAVMLLGEQHDAPAHQARQREVLGKLQSRGVLAALVIEMAERGGSTRGLAPGASEAQVQQALHWPASEAAGWDWAVYGPLVMQAVRHRVPVLGGNLPRTQLRSVMQDASFDERLAAPAWQMQQTQIREGHCQLLPETQVVPMTRVQLARDIAMARTIEAALAPGKTVLLVAGNQHVRRDLGIPQHLRPDLQSTVVLMASGDPGDAHGHEAADRVWRTEPLPEKDHCAAFKARMQR
jgi:uncharacterized iron-regulated protein